MNTKSEPSSSAKWNTPAIYLLGLSAVWLISLAIVNPVGNFPLNDDWSFGQTVRHLLETGDFRPTGWASMTLITNVLWGALFCLPDGFSFTALRFSTLAASWLGIWGTYLLVRELRQSNTLALLTALTLAFNPVYFALSNTFMTDVLCQTLMVFAALFFAKYFNISSKRNLLLGTVFALTATLSRQVGLAVPLAFGLVLVFQRGCRWGTVIRAAVPLAICTGGMFLFQHWQAATGRLPALYDFKNIHFFGTVSHPTKFIPVLINSIYISLLYLGLFLSPILLSATTRFKVRLSNNFGSARMFLFSFGALLALTVVHGLCGKGYLMPMSGNILNRGGIGPCLLRDAFLPQASLPVLPEWFWLIVTIISVLGGALLATLLVNIVVVNASQFRFTRLDRQNSAGLFLLATSLVYMAPFLMGGFLDRYLIPIIPLLAAGILSLAPPLSSFKPTSNVPMVGLLLAAFLVFSICGTRDYLAWNRIRWQALNRLMNHQHVQPENIDGGFEFNGYYLYNPNYQAQPGKSFWWVHNDTYQITFRKLPGFTVFKKYHYTRWMPPSTGTIFVLKKNNQAESQK